MVMLVSGSTRFPWGAQMKKILLAGVATGALAIAAPASAADLRMPVKAAPIAAPAPYFSWTGCYVGVHAGWGWGQKQFSSAPSSTSSQIREHTGTVDNSGGLFGGQLGCNYQFQNNFVLGLEGSIAGADINGRGFSLSRAETLSAKTDFLASLTGRLGWTGWSPQTMFYVKGGVAWAHDRLGSEGDDALADQSRTGWTIGIGVEWAFAPNWSAFAEWDHYDFGTDRVGFCDGRGGCSSFDLTDVKQRVETFKVGVNYRFNLGFLGVGKAPFGKGPIAARY
jgi:outer membrane immunogenic protein